HFRKKNQIAACVPVIPNEEIVLAQRWCSELHNNNEERPQGFNSCGEGDIPGSVELTLVRIWNADFGGLTKRELKQSREFLSLTAYGNDPEDGDDVVSALQTFPGACQAKDGLTFKVMNSMEQVSVFTASLPAKLYHVLVLIPSKEKVVMDLALGEARKYHTAMAGTGPMDVDGSSTSGSGTVDDIIVEEAFKQLSSLVRIDGDSDKRNIFTAQESMETFHSTCERPIA
ncbi:hypothetical protein HDU82_003508, partial [Entophlyctis luteolus]